MPLKYLVFEAIEREMTASWSQIATANYQTKSIVAYRLCSGLEERSDVGRLQAPRRSVSEMRSIEAAEPPGFWRSVSGDRFRHSP